MSKKRKHQEDEENTTTLLHIAAKNGDGHICKLLLSANADVNAVDENGSAPLHLAAQHGNQLTVAALLEANADVEARDANGQTALYTATVGRKFAIVDTLINAGANVNCHKIVEKEHEEEAAMEEEDENTEEGEEATMDEEEKALLVNSWPFKSSTLGLKWKREDYLKLFAFMKLARKNKNWRTALKQQEWALQSRGVQRTRVCTVVQLLECKGILKSSVPKDAWSLEKYVEDGKEPLPPWNKTRRLQNVKITGWNGKEFKTN